MNIQNLLQKITSGFGIDVQDAYQQRNKKNLVSEKPKGRYCHLFMKAVKNFDMLGLIRNQNLGELCGRVDFISDALKQSYQIIMNSNLSEQQAISSIMNIRDPDNKIFIKEKEAQEIVQKFKKLSQYRNHRGGQKIGGRKSKNSKSQAGGSKSSSEDDDLGDLGDLSTSGDILGSDSGADSSGDLSGDLGSDLGADSSGDLGSDTSGLSDSDSDSKKNSIPKLTDVPSFLKKNQSKSKSDESESDSELNSDDTGKIPKLKDTPDFLNSGNTNKGTNKPDDASDLSDLGDLASSSDQTSSSDLTLSSDQTSSSDQTPSSDSDFTSLDDSEKSAPSSDSDLLDLSDSSDKSKKDDSSDFLDLSDSSDSSDPTTSKTGTSSNLQQNVQKKSPTKQPPTPPKPQPKFTANLNSQFHAPVPPPTINKNIPQFGYSNTPTHHTVKQTGYYSKENQDLARRIKEGTQRHDESSDLRGKAIKLDPIQKSMINEHVDMMEVMLICLSMLPLLGWGFDFPLVLYSLFNKKYTIAILTVLNWYIWMFWLVFGMNINMGPILKSGYLGNQHNIIKSFLFDFDRVSKLRHYRARVKVWKDPKTGDLFLKDANDNLYDNKVAGGKVKVSGYQMPDGHIVRKRDKDFFKKEEEFNKQQKKIHEGTYDEKTDGKPIQKLLNSNLHSPDLVGLISARGELVRRDDPMYQQELERKRINMGLQMKGPMRTSVFKKSVDEIKT